MTVYDECIELVYLLKLDIEGFYEYSHSLKCAKQGEDTEVKNLLSKMLKDFEIINKHIQDCYEY